MSATPVTLTVPARPEYARLLRGVGDAIAAGADWSADLIDDLELAVTEAAGAVLAAGNAERLTLEITPHADGMRCRVEADIEGDPQLSLDAVRDMVLGAVTASHETDPAAGAITFVIAPG